MVKKTFFAVLVRAPRKVESDIRSPCCVASERLRRERYRLIARFFTKVPSGNSGSWGRDPLSIPPPQIRWSSLSVSLSLLSLSEGLARAKMVDEAPVG